MTSIQIAACIIYLTLLPLHPICALTASDSSDTLFIDAIVEPEAPYFQQQVKYTLRLWRHSHLQRGYFLTPELPDVLLIPAAAEKTRNVIRDGQTYELLQQSYFIFPQRSGEIILPAPVFSSQELFIKGQPQVLIVKPGKKHLQPWVIANNITLNQQWKLPGLPLQAGQAIERTVVIQGQDISGAQLPRAVAPPIEKTQIQTLASETHTEIQDNRVHGTRIERFRYIPSAGGNFHLGDIKILWWDSENDSASQTVLPGRYVSIDPETAANIDIFKSHLEENTAGTEINRVKEQDLPESFIPVFTTVVLFLLLIAVVAFLICKYNLYSRLQKQLDLSSLRRKVLHACGNNDIKQLKEHFLCWAQLKLNTKKPLTLLHLTQFTSDQALIDILTTLDQALYSNQQRPLPAKQLKHKLKRFMSTAVFTQQKNSQGLPELWPIKNKGQEPVRKRIFLMMKQAPGRVLNSYK